MREESLAGIRGNIRSRGYRRVSHGLFLPEESGEGAASAWLRDLHAWRAVLPDDAVYTHVTAAELAGWWLPPLPDWTPTFVAMDRLHRGPRRPGLVVSRLDRDETPRQLRGLPVDAPEEVLLRCARDLGILDLAPMVSSALRRGDLTDRALTEICDSSRPGVRRLRAAASVSEPRAESAWELLLQIFHSCLDVATDPQVDLFDARGTFVGRADLLVRGTNLVHEYDGAVHRDRARHSLDLRRDRRLSEAGYRRHGYTADDLLNHPAVVMAEMDRALGRRSRLRRLERWRALVQDSLYGDAGRTRLRSRWNRSMGLTDWSQTAG